MASDLEYEVTNAITLQVIDVIEICNSAQVGPSTSWALVLCTCCTIHCYATANGCILVAIANNWVISDNFNSERSLSLKSGDY